jgi:hypothetical protein
MAAVGFALGGVLAARGALVPLGAWLARPPASIGPEAALPGLFGIPSWAAISVVLGVLLLLLLRLPRPAAPSDAWPWGLTGAAIGAIGILAWVTGRAAGWHWGLSVTGPSRSLFAALFLDWPPALDWGALMLAGLVVGSWVGARLQGPVAWTAPAARDLPRRFVGGLLMGAGGTVAGGCNIGNALTGLSILSVHSLIATAAIAVGGALGARLLDRAVPRG